jgi:hypothetical protein
MSHRSISAILCAALAVAALVPARPALAVGNGIPFVAHEGFVPGADAHPVPANSLDFTYHSCVHFFEPDRFRESGYFWVSSFQNATSVVDAQLNGIDPKYYRIYGVYTYKAGQWGQPQPTPTGTRLNYVASFSEPHLELWVDVNQDTQLGLQDCRPVRMGADEDIKLGECNTLAQGEKSETDGLANGDFKIVFGDSWAFTAFGAQYFGNPAVPADFRYLVFNGNVTRLRNALDVDHLPEGSGNLYWRTQFVPLPVID